MFLLRSGFIPRLVRSEISFFLNTIESIAGLISKASLALKYVSSLFDSNARRGRLIVKEPSLIEVPICFSSAFSIALVERVPFEKITFPPLEIIVESALDTSVIFPIS